VASAKPFRQTSDDQLRKKIVLVGEISSRPDDTGGRHFRLRFGAKFYRPYYSAVVSNDNLWLRAAAIFFHELKSTTGFVLLAAGAIEKVAQLARYTCGDYVAGYEFLETARSASVWKQRRAISSRTSAHGRILVFMSKAMPGPRVLKNATIGK
jgi:hypothetical protein